MSSHRPSPAFSRKNRGAKLTGVAMCLLLSSSSTGCSLIFVKTPAKDGRVSSSLSGGRCTSSKVAPALDTLFAGLQVVRTGMAASASDSVYDNPNAPLSRGADIALGAGFAALFASSAIYGFVNTSRCSRRHQPEVDPQRRNGPDRPETWDTTPTPATRPGPAPASPPPLASPSTPSTPPNTEPTQDQPQPSNGEAEPTQDRPLSPPSFESSPPPTHEK